MAHFARIENGCVVEVIVVDNSDCGGGVFPESEPAGQAFIAGMGLVGDWLQTSYNGNFRDIYAGIGYTFNPDAGEHGTFVAPIVKDVD
jgi:hypothetical protein